MTKPRTLDAFLPFKSGNSSHSSPPSSPSRAMFRSHKSPALSPTTDYTGTLRETSFYRHGQLRRLGLGGEVAALAVDPLLSLLAVAAGSAVHVYGGPAFQFTLPVGGRVKFLAFHPGHSRLVVVDESNTLHSFALNNIVESTNPNVSPPLPKKEASYPLFGEITAIEQPLPSYTHMLLAMRDGVTLAWDLRQATLSKFQIPNLWAMYEERLVRSGVPDRHKTIGGPQATCTAINPRDLNILLIGYEGGVVAYDFQKGETAKTFELTLPPGAPGGGSYHDDALWSERRPAVTSITWRPDGLVFAVGHADGCIAFWAYADADKPFMVRTLTHEDVHVPDAEALMDAGALPSSEPQVSHEIEGMPVLSARVPTAVGANREPIFKLTWAGFPDQAALKLIAVASEVPLTNATAEYSERGETLLVVLGGQSPGEKPGINLLQFPAYTPPMPSVGAKKAALLAEGLTAAERQAFRDSLAPTGSSNYPTKTPPEDFVLQPRSSPYFNMAHDAVALFVLLTPDNDLPVPSEPSAQRQLDAFVFPPPRSDNPPPALGRKTYVTPGNEDLVAMTPEPRGPAVHRVQSGQSVSSWRFPWTASTPDRSPAVSVTSLALSTTGRQDLRRRLRVPSQLWSGGLSVIGARLISLPTPTFMRLLAHTIATEEIERVPRVPLRGGMAVPDLHSAGAPDLKVAKMENYRVLTTWHTDCTVRFWDISPHILVLPTPLHFEYPAPLPHLTIHVGSILRRPEVEHLPIAKLWATDRSKVQISGVHLARETLECVVLFTTGEVLVAKFGEARRSNRSTPSSPLTPAVGEDDGDADDASSTGYFPQQEWVEEVTELGQIANWTTDGFKPVALCTVRRGAVISCAVSDIGFIAVAYEQNSLAILDMRGPDVILREGFDGDGRTMKRRKRKAHPQNVAAEGSQIGAMRWTVSGMGGDQALRPRLIVSYQSGKTKVYCLNNVLGEWLVDPKPPTFQNDSLASPIATYLLDPISGNELLASPEALADVANDPVPEGKWTKDAPPHCVWITACKRTIRVAVNFNGERVAKIELEEDLASVHYITRHGKRILVALTTAGSALVYTVPHLEFVTRLDLFFGNTRPVGSLSFDDRSGDFIEFAGPLDITLRTLFHFRKPFPPRIDPCFLKTPIPAQPTPLSSSSFGWMWGAGPLTGAALDSLISPVRAAPPKPPPPPRQPLLTWDNAVTWGEPPKPKSEPAHKPEPKVKNQAVRKVRAPEADGRERNDAYSQMREGLERRGEALDSLGVQLDNVGKAAGQYFQAARGAVAKESAKAAGKGMFSKVW
ncbi:uncharacterized protein CcaverHIS019_0111050 [Cutaneotrichosporon cavernicola]|uniref:Lethal giant larvae (Lgl)-like C-terminal domain-containing protein n=1 Tax=Cutaneotrichosporon cavernicola TaxID=279322 RepID=A0AA48L149_9TREE|nr:uncharacterized protein CcaverHIS019_0111050 [Cutaneotrichosporon cavernicola]BEI88387.1 hypothetical protein CcaverHIS019_0111050 [Cutaneotrichosporon cavernicola]BEJ03932.1 hypothetical protein CcaverHIS641_0111070 [Cutaneotrichosporon cavernicola]